MSAAMIFIDELMDLNSLTTDDIRSIFVLRLPFRLRIGTLRRVRYDDSIELVFRKRIDVPHGTTPTDGPVLGSEEMERFFTDAAVVCQLSLQQSAVAELVNQLREREYSAGSHHGFLHGINDRSSDAREALNDTLIAYHTATGDRLSGWPLSRFSYLNFGRCMQIHALHLQSQASPSSETLINQLFEKMWERWTFQPPSSSGGWDDFPAEVSDRINESLALHQKFIFFEFAWKAERCLADDDMISSILFSVVALEAAQATFIRLTARRRFMSIEDDAVREELVNTFTESILEKQGIFRLLRWTALYLMETDSRPTEDELRDCERGVTLRNDIMHARMKNNLYKLRAWNAKEIRVGYDGIRRVYERYVAAIDAIEGRDSFHRCKRGYLSA